jgi:hypothetical protein
MSFSGFSEDDIRKLTKAQNVNKSQKGNVHASIEQLNFYNCYIAKV